MRHGATQRRGGAAIPLLCAMLTQTVFLGDAGGTLWRRVDLDISLVSACEKHELRVSSRAACPVLAHRRGHNVFCRSDDWCLTSSVTTALAGPQTPDWTCYTSDPEDCEWGSDVIPMHSEYALDITPPLGPKIHCSPLQVVCTPEGLKPPSSSMHVAKTRKCCSEPLVYTPAGCLLFNGTQTNICGALQQCILDGGSLFTADTDAEFEKLIGYVKDKGMRGRYRVNLHIRDRSNQRTSDWIWPSTGRTQATDTITWKNSKPSYNYENYNVEVSSEGAYDVSTHREKIGFVCRYAFTECL